MPLPDDRPDLFYHHCPACGGQFPSPSRAVTVCAGCLEARRAAVRALEARYPSAAALGLTDAPWHPTERYHPPFERHVRPSGSGRRVVRKSEPLAG